MKHYLAELKRQELTLTKVDRIISVMSTFEDSSANCIQGILSSFSAKKYTSVCLYANRFLEYVDALFVGLEYIDSAHAAALATATISVVSDQFLAGRKEPKQLAKKIVRYFAMLSGSDSEDRVDVKSDLIEIVTALATHLKSLIRLALNGSMKIEREIGTDTCVFDFLDVIADAESTSNSKTEATIIESLSQMNLPKSCRTDFCFNCQKSTDDACFKSINDAFCWDSDCFKCSTCQKSLVNEQDLNRVGFEEETGFLYCNEHLTGRCLVGKIRRVTQLQQFSYLLHFALGRLYEILNSQDYQVQSESAVEIPQLSPIISQGLTTSISSPNLAYSSSQQQQSLRPTIRGNSVPDSLNAVTSIDEIAPSDDDMHAPQIFSEFTKLKPTVRRNHTERAGSERVLSEQSALSRMSIERQALAYLEEIMGRKLPELGMEKHKPVSKNGRGKVSGSIGNGSNSGIGGTISGGADGSANNGNGRGRFTALGRFFSGGNRDGGNNETKLPVQKITTPTGGKPAK
ncbi:hypothetical protein HK100_002688, partial [Physocladia obscura]